MVSSGLTMFGATTQQPTNGLYSTALGISQRRAKATLLLWWTMSCTSLVDELRKERTLATLQHLGFRLDDGIRSKTWGLPLPLALDIA